MSVQVVYKNNAKSSNSSVLAIFSDEKFDINLSKNLIKKGDISYLKKLLNNKKNSKDKIFSLNLNDKRTILVISISKNIEISTLENLGAKFYDFVCKNSFKEISLMQESFPKKNYQNLFGHFVHGFNLKSYSFDKYKSKKINSSIKVEVIGKYKNENLKKLNALERGIFYTRDLVSEPGNILHPDEYAKRLLKLRKLGIKVNVYDKKKLKKLGCNAI